MYNFPLVSIGLTTYNRPTHLKNALFKLSNQTYKNIEIIVADDNPLNEDNFLIYKNNFSTDSRINYHKKTVNEGMNLNFIYALSKARGKFFMWAADDDDWAENYIEECVQILEANDDVLMACTKAYLMNNKYEIFNIHNADINTSKLPLKEKQKKILKNIPPYNTGFYGLYRTAFLKTCYFPNSLSNDRILVLETATKGEIVQSDKVLFYYCSEGDSVNINKYLMATKAPMNSFLKAIPALNMIFLHLKGVLFHWDHVSLYGKLITVKSLIRSWKSENRFNIIYQQICKLFLTKVLWKK
ncbi:glycosyltransferase family 2 protein [Catalinimonas niigatensis]|uniref:glycosyltransferase family 2 protein n=1 Tax=Catalinimonas niigatensis TaxID=1397264 RepID=UPI002665233F|nr:glycosyltransferase family 2 protein [Catalinimonas niigatensis]WPP52629.1 glycosyltransferase family 2 protein [Catalinimonas niigatensis]